MTVLRPRSPLSAQSRAGGRQLPALPGIDLSLVAILVLLAGSGLALLFSASHYYGGLVFGDELHFLRRQVVYLLVGLVAAAMAAVARLERLRSLTPALLALTLLLVVLTFVPGIGVSALGAQRWLNVGGQSFEPSEPVKLALVLYLAHILSKKEADLGTSQFSNTVLPPLLITGAFAALIYLQNDFSSAFYVLFLALAMFFVAGVRVRYFLALGSLSVPLSALLLLSRDHRVERLIAFVDPGVDPAGSGYQVLAARAAVSSGGVWGRGLGAGQIKLGGVPEAHSDFVFAVIGEELGLVGVLLVIGLFCALAWRGLQIARAQQDRFRGLLAFGATVGIVGQAFLNMAVVAGLLPATGMPLPFFSAGGSSLLVTLTLCGLLLNVSRSRAAEGTS